MEALRALRLRVATVVITALLLQLFAPALHANARKSAAGGPTWAELCTSSGQTVRVLVGVDVDLALAREGLRQPVAHGDHHCASCLTFFAAVPTRASGVGPIALGEPARLAIAHHGPDRESAWSKQQSRGPPPSR